MANVKDFFTIAEVSKFYGLQRGSIYQAIKTKRLAAKKENGRVYISREALAAYRLNRYSRAGSWFGEELAFDKNKGEYSLPEAAKFLEVSKNFLYYSCGRNSIPYTRKNVAYVFKLEDLKDLKKRLTRKPVTGKKTRV